MPKQSKSEERTKLREALWPNDEAIWTGENEKGWFRAPRTLPLILAVLDSKEISGNKKPSLVYVELLSRHLDNGIVAIAHEADHALATGYSNARGKRSWEERMEILEKSGFIKSKGSGARKFKQVLLVHPDFAFRRLIEQKKVPDDIWHEYQKRQIDSRAVPFHEQNKVVSVGQKKKPRGRKT